MFTQYLVQSLNYSYSYQCCCSAMLDLSMIFYTVIVPKFTLKFVFVQNCDTEVMLTQYSSISILSAMNWFRTDTRAVVSMVEDGRSGRILHRSGSSWMDVAKGPTQEDAMLSLNRLWSVVLKSPTVLYGSMRQWPKWHAWTVSQLYSIESLRYWLLLLKGKEL